MFGQHTAKWLWALAALIVANVGWYLYSNWGLVTVKAHDEPLKEVISSIEWQGWVKIYTNLPLDSKVTMYCDHVPLAEAMETLAANVDVPPPPDAGDDSDRPRRNGPGGPGNSTNAASATAPSASTNGAPVVAGGPPPGGGPGGPGAGGPPGGRFGGGGPGGPGGGGFRAAQWNLAFFTGPNAAQVKQEIREFENSDPNDDNKVYTYNTQSQIFSTDSTTVAPDPAQQSWPGYKPPPPPDPNAQASVNGSTNAPAGQNAPTDQASQPDPNAPPTVHTYFQALAAAANIWIMAPGSWAPQVAAPAATSSIIDAVKNLVSSGHGVVVEALVLRAGRGGSPGNSNRNDDNWEDRMMNAINGLPPDERPDAIEQLHKEVDFRKSLANMTPDQRRQAMAEHFVERTLYGERMDRLSPEKRAKMYQRMIQFRQASKSH
jgi:hypothetical protein